jgi:hypothetical protein
VFRALIHRLIADCKDGGRGKVAEAIGALLKEISPQDFLEWVKEDREYCFYYYEVEQSGACAKPREAAAMILEAIALDEIEEESKTD